jgi:hypothetical protein
MEGYGQQNETRRKKDNAKGHQGSRRRKTEMLRSKWNEIEMSI